MTLRELVRRRSDSLVMRKLAFHLALSLLAAPFVAAVVLAPLPSSAADFPAFADGGSILTTIDAGFYVCGTAKTSVPNGFNAAVRCTPFGVYYVACEDATCVPTQANLYLAPDVTYDIGMPGGHKTLCIKTFDGGVPSCQYLHNRGRGE
jgi:hypothetical protein